IWTAPGRIGTRYFERRAIPSWQPPMPTPARGAASCATSLSQRKPKSELLSARANAPRRTQGPAVAVEADDAVMRQVRDRARLAEPGAIVAVRVEADARRADAPGDEAALRRTHHAHGDVRVAARQVLVAVGDGELDDDARMSGVKAGEDR